MAASNGSGGSTFESTGTRTLSVPHTKPHTRWNTLWHTWPARSAGRTGAHLASVPLQAPSSHLERSASSAQDLMSEKATIQRGSEMYIRNVYHFIDRIKDAVRLRGEQVKPNITQCLRGRERVEGARNGSGQVSPAPWKMPHTQSLLTSQNATHSCSSSMIVSTRFSTDLSRHQHQTPQ